MVTPAERLDHAPVTIHGMSLHHARIIYDIGVEPAGAFTGRGQADAPRRPRSPRHESGAQQPLQVDDQVERLPPQLLEERRNVHGGAEKIAADFHGEVVESDQVKMRDLPPALQEMMLQMQVGQATRPFGSIEEGVRVLVLCGRDEVDPSAPSFDQVYAQLNEERINLRSRRYLRDLRRDAVIDFR